MYLVASAGLSVPLPVRLSPLSQLNPGFPKFAGHAGHVQQILKMSGGELPDRRTKCPATKKLTYVCRSFLAQKCPTRA